MFNRSARFLGSTLLPRVFLLLGMTLLTSVNMRANGAGPDAVLLSDLKALQRLEGVLYVAAHPDDENTQLITYLARGRYYRTGYLSLTRGDGGQNVLQADFGERLGVARTQELLAARRLDGGQQFFTRALDFGFSKDYEETLRVWDRKQVLGDVVRVIRQFRPDVIVTRFSPTPGGTHGHHTASAVLAVEAFKLAGDRNAYPEQLATLEPWQPKRVLWNVWRGGGSGDDLLRIDVAGTDLVSGRHFSDLAGHSRAQHKTQGFDTFAIAAGGGPRTETFHLLAGEPAGTDLMDGVGTGWNNWPGGAGIEAALARLVESFEALSAAQRVSHLLDLRRLLSSLPADPLLEEKRAALDRLIVRSAGLAISTTVPVADVVPGEAVPLTHRVELASDVPVRWLSVRLPAAPAPRPVDQDVSAGREYAVANTLTIPPDAPLSHPYWLRRDVVSGMFRVDDPSLIGKAENPAEFPVQYTFEVGGEQITVFDEPVLQATAGLAWERQRKLAVVAPVALRFESDVELFVPGSTRDVVLQVVASHADVRGTVELEVPAGWTASGAREFILADMGQTARLTFSVTAAQRSDTAVFTARASLGGRDYRANRVDITYRHIPVQLLQPDARMKAASLELAIRGNRVGYIAGAGDTVAEALRQMGFEVSQLAAEQVTAEGLRGLDAVVVGVRALNTRADLAGRMPTLYDFAAAGGNLVLQYNLPGGLKVESISPIPLTLSSARVTDETAAVTILADGHPVLRGPNKIVAADFAGWVQERGLYFPSEWDPAFTPILAMNDRGEAPLKGGLLVARHGQGHVVYTGLSFFRQLPAGVPGAYRLFANMVSLGK